MGLGTGESFKKVNLLKRYTITFEEAQEDTKEFFKNNYHINKEFCQICWQEDKRIIDFV